ncbi:MAG: chemotaxis protein CheW [Balneolaceae bacterium]
MEIEKENGDTFIHFLLGEDEYAIRILDVQEIITPLPITPVPGTPDSILGVVNLRGKIVPMMDLRRTLGLSPKPVGETSCFVIIQYRHWLMGVVVDRVSGVTDAGEVGVSQKRENGNEGIDRFVTGDANREEDEGSIQVLNVEKLVTDEYHEEIYR